MVITPLTESECRDLLARSRAGRLGCAVDNQPYIVPVNFAFEQDFVYLFSTEGQKVEWLRANPKACLQVDEIADQFQWTSVIATGLYEELAEPQFTEERAHARELLSGRYQWWLNAVAERRLSTPDVLIEPIFYRIRIGSLSGLRAEASPED